MSLGSSVTLRPIAPEDEPFLLRVYASTRAEELALFPWSDERKDEFVRSQHRAQQAHYDANHPHASFQLVLVDGSPAGRLYVQRADDGIHLLDIALLPDYRGTGIGTALLEDLLAEADERAVRVTAHVERHNRALKLYERLGFREIANREVYLLIERPCAASPTVR
ncbi:MAG: GNAT family N-acetyltransferase [Solirubrobacteraceae bacterium]